MIYPETPVRQMLLFISIFYLIYYVIKSEQKFQDTVLPFNQK